MGISGLLPLLKSIHRPCNLKKFAGQTIGVDAYGWLHRGTIACAIDLALEKPTMKFVDFAMCRVKMLNHFGVVPYLVFDGDYLPSKAVTEIERSKKREESKRIGLELYRMGKPSQAHLELQKAVDVTPEMARQLIEELKKNNIQFVVAPYEADAQLVYLEKKGVIQGILSEDSDMLVFGAKLLLTKLDQYGDCIAIHRDEFTACREINLTGWSDVEFRRMAILSGCDYLPSINKMGLKTAYRLVRKHKSIEKILRMLQFDGQFHVPPGYLEQFRKAELTFLHQRVFCPDAGKLVMATELTAPMETEDLSFVGKDVEPHIALGVALGDLNPMTKKPIIVKTRAFGTPRTPWSKSRQQVTEAPSDLKSKKPIDSYYKLYRQPLAELDINTLTPSPTQSRLLGQYRGTTWLSSPAPSPIVTQIARPRTSLPSSSVRTTPATANRPTRPRGTPTPDADQRTNPPKRLRLCEDVDKTFVSLDLSKLDKVETEHSPFFSGSVPSLPPAIKGPRKGKKPKKSSFSIWSDDSLEEAMAAMPDVSTQPQVSTSAAFVELNSINADISESNPKEIVQVQVLTTDTIISSTEMQSSGPESTPTISRGSSAPTHSPLTLSSNCTKTDFLDVKHELTAHSDFSLDRFRSNQSEVATSPNLPSLTRKKQYKSRIPLSLISGGGMGKPCFSSGALRSIGQSAFRRKETVVAIEVEQSKFHTVQIRQSPEAEEISPSKGSEDLLVANSEDENDHASSSPNSEIDGLSKKIDLKGFGFTT
ncbi:MAG: Rad2 nuclease [Icmadophila ericetorum]|nr:Rad2 nuclease [Icmadophila ericetorum]